MARPVRVRKSYTGDRSRLSRLELAVEKDPRLSLDQRQALSEQIRKLVGLLMELDSKLPPLPPTSDSPARPKRPRKRDTASA
jgi:hypothetical protein